jgi:hypothetical protein
MTTVKYSDQQMTVKERNYYLLIARYTHCAEIGNHKYYDIVERGKEIRIYILNAAKKIKEKNAIKEINQRTGV